LESFDAPTPSRQAKNKKQKHSFETRQLDVFPDLATAIDDRFDFEDTIFARSELAYLERIRTMVAENNAKLIVIRVFSYLNPPLTDNVREKLTKLVPEQLSPPDDVYRAAGHLFADAMHLNVKGREIYTNWLSDEIVKMQALK
jgi:hypothetical protein